MTYRDIMITLGGVALLCGMFLGLGFALGYMIWGLG